SQRLDMVKRDAGAQEFPLTRDGFCRPQKDRSAARQVSTLKQGGMDESVDDSALDNALSDEEENFSSINLAEHLSRIDSVAPSEVPQREGLYSTPLSWERPQPGLRMDSIMSIQ